VLGAEVVLVSKPDGALRPRRLPLEDFFAGPGRTQRGPGELLAAIELPLPVTGFHGEFLKFGTRPALDISTISIGVGAVTTEGRWQSARIAFGAVAPTPMRVQSAEAALEGSELGEPSIEAAVRAADEAIHPISDVRASEWYRRELVHNLLRRVLRSVGER
jgi:CO/xanthine dehydrogenase FAD-binding subunit